MTSTRMDSPVTPKQQLIIHSISGLCAGTFCAGLLNPWDRALYLSVKNKIAFLCWNNFKSPYQGFSQAIVQRTLLGSIYYIAQGEMSAYAYPYLRNQLGVSESITQFCIGTLAGSLYGALGNIPATVKYYTWGKEGRTFFSSTNEMWNIGGCKPFFKGTRATVLRDAAFGSTYEVMRNLMRHQLPASKDSRVNFACNSLAAALGTLASSPFNYARTFQYATPPNVKPPAIHESLKNVWQEAKNQPRQLLGKTSFLLTKFRAGWGTARVATGMAIGQEVRDIVSDQLNKNYRQQK